MDADAAFRELYRHTKERMEAGGAHSFDHVERVLRLAGRIAGEEGADPEVVRFAALLHDIERGAEDRGEVEDHAAASADVACRLLLERGFDAGFAQEVAACILTHRFRNDLRPESLEARV
ncbi:MAG: HD domain-containing protein, partial [Euryarchaeota archaeon]|nr:HD domain-containing protein [Euryarchaeota archaeon]